MEIATSDILPSCININREGSICMKSVFSEFHRFSFEFHEFQRISRISTWTLFNSRYSQGMETLLVFLIFFWFFLIPFIFYFFIWSINRDSKLWEFNTKRNPSNIFTFLSILFLKISDEDWNSKGNSVLIYKNHGKVWIIK